LKIAKISLKVNGGIRAPKVRLIDENKEMVGIVERQEAMQRAISAGLDLVEVSPTSEPPVCRVMDYGKWLYQQKRKLRDAHKKNPHHNPTVKGIRLRPETDKHDLDVKLKRAREFLEKGDRVQFTMFFRGRQMLHKDRGFTVLENVVDMLSELAKVEQQPKMAFRRITMTLAPK
jgi:translation initiation factor IF-3